MLKRVVPGSSRYAVPSEMHGIVVYSADVSVPWPFETVLARLAGRGRGAVHARVEAGSGPCRRVPRPGLRGAARRAVRGCRSGARRPEPDAASLPAGAPLPHSEGRRPLADIELRSG